MSNGYNAKNYFAHGGNELVIGGKLTFLPGAEVEGADALPAAFAESTKPSENALGMTSVPPDFSTLS